MSIRIGIVGGGPGGLTLARLLQMNGMQVTVFERDASATARFSGGSLDMAPDSGRKAIRAAGLDAAFRRRARPEGDAYIISDQTGRITFRTPPFRFASRRPEIDRADLKEILLSSLAPDTVHWGRRFAGLTDEGGRQRIHFEDGTTAEVDLVIGADGARSRVRPLVTSQMPYYSGGTLLQGDIANPAVDCPAIQQWVRNANFFALGNAIGLFIQARSTGALSLYVSLRIAEDAMSDVDLSSRDAVAAYASEALRGWHPAFLEAVEASAPLVARPLVRTVDTQSWTHRPAITLIGDAAHVMPPFGGEGANMAMLDAVMLSRELARSPDDVAAAIVRYEREMFARTGNVQRSTAALQEMFHAPDAADRLARAFLGPMEFMAPVVPAAVSAMEALLPKRSGEG